MRFHEEILLIALREEDGKIDSKASFEYTTIMAAAILADLLLLKKIATTEEKKPKIKVIDPTGTGNSVLDSALEKIRESKPRTPADWAGRLAQMKGLREETAENLCDKSVLKAEEGTVFFFFDKTYYPELDPKPEQDLIKRLETAIFTDSDDTDDRTLVLLALLHKSTMLQIPFDKKELKKRQERMEALSNGNIAGKAAREAVETAQIAVIVTTAIIPAVTVTTM